MICVFFTDNSIWQLGSKYIMGTTRVPVKQITHGDKNIKPTLVQCAWIDSRINTLTCEVNMIYRWKEEEIKEH